MRVAIILISLIAGIVTIDLLNYPTAAQGEPTEFHFTNTSNVFLYPNGRMLIGIEARGHDGTADNFFYPQVVPRKVWIDQGSIVLVPQEPHLSFWGSLNLKLEAMLFRMWFVSDTGDSIIFFNEIINANFSPANLAVASYEVDLPVANNWRIKADCGTAGGGRFVDAEIELVGHWQ